MPIRSSQANPFRLEPHAQATFAHVVNNRCRLQRFVSLAPLSVLVSRILVDGKPMVTFGLALDLDRASAYLTNTAPTIVLELGNVIEIEMLNESPHVVDVAVMFGLSQDAA